MKSAAHGAAAPLLVLLLLATAPRAEEPEQYLVEYRASIAALEAGDTAGAIEHGRAAWQAAEQALGDHRLTAIAAVLEAAKNWRAIKIPENLDPVCAKNYTTTVHFIIED